LANAPPGVFRRVFWNRVSETSDVSSAIPASGINCKFSGFAVKLHFFQKLAELFVFCTYVHYICVLIE